MVKEDNQSLPRNKNDPRVRGSLLLEISKGRKYHYLKAFTKFIQTLLQYIRRISVKTGSG
jgi:hypothetical protein